MYSDAVRRLSRSIILPKYRVSCQVGRVGIGAFRCTLVLLKSVAR
jgi:hypothetical protein